MRILLVTEDIPFPNMGGLAKHVLNLARALVRAGHEVDLLGSDAHPIEICGAEGRFGGRFIGALRGAHLGWKEVSLGAYMPPRRALAARRFAQTILAHAQGYDVVHYHGHIPNVGRYLPEELNFVQTRHDQGSDCFRHTRFRDDGICSATDPAACASCITEKPNILQRAVSAVAVRQFRRDVQQSFTRHQTIFVSDILRRNFVRSAGPGDWGVVVHNFVDRNLLEHMRCTATAPPPGEFHVFIAAKMYPAKGVEPFLKALVRHLPADLRLAIAGDGPDERRLRTEYAGEQIQFLGWTSPEETLARAASAHAVVVPSVWEEPCATTVLEGLFLGKPTFALRRGGTPELAIYASDPAQLRLHADMGSLVDDLATFGRDRRFGVLPDGAGSVDSAINELIRIYLRKLPGFPAGVRRAAIC